MQEPKFTYPKPELPHADFYSVWRPVLSADAAHTQKSVQAVGTDGLLTKEPLAGVKHQAALLRASQVEHTGDTSPHGGGLHLQEHKVPVHSEIIYQVGRWFSRSTTKSLLQGPKYNKIN